VEPGGTYEEEMTPALLAIGTKLIDRLLPDKALRDEMKLKLLELEQAGELALLSAETELARGQLEVNRQEAASDKLFVAGWRPSVGWICSAGLAYQFLFHPLLSWLALYNGVPGPPEIDMGALITLLVGMLGLGGLRTTEKLRGVQGRH
jgi:hypothetical protein